MVGNLIRNIKNKKLYEKNRQKHQSVCNKFANEEIKEFDLIVWVHYYDIYPVALIGVVLEYSPPKEAVRDDAKKAVRDDGTIFMEALDANYRGVTVGYVDVAAVLPVIFADESNLEDSFLPPSSNAREEIQPEYQGVTKKDQAKRLHENLSAGNRVIFREDIPEEMIIKGMLAQVVNKIGNKLKVCFVYMGLKNVSEKTIIVDASTCVPIYFAYDKGLGKDLDRNLIFYSWEINKNI
jgi:hypothetical protein